MRFTMKVCWLVLLSLMMTVSAGNVLAEPFTGAGIKLDVTASPDKPEIMLGEPCYLSFKVANLSDRPLRIMIGGDYRNSLGRPDSFKVKVVDSDGKLVPQPSSGMQMGGMASFRNLPTKGEFTFRLFVPHWATFEKPGRYSLTIRRTLELVPDDRQDPFAVKPHRVEVVATTSMTVVPKDAAKLGVLIDTLGRQSLDENANNHERARKMLAAIHDERVIPHFIRLAEQNDYTSRSDAVRPLGQYRNEQAFEALKKLAKTQGADIRHSATTEDGDESMASGLRRHAINTLFKSPHPAAIPLMWSYAADPDYRIRLTILHRSADLKTPEARAFIQKTLMDKDESLRIEALRYQKIMTKEASHI